MVNSNQKDGRWVTVCGRHIFIAKGQTLSAAIGAIEKLKNKSSKQNKSSDTKEKQNIYLKSKDKEIDKISSENIHKSENEKSTKKTFINLKLFSYSYADKPEASIKKSIRHNEKNIEKHKYKIQHPEEFYLDWGDVSDIVKAGRIKKWEREIDEFKKQIEKAKKELEKRKKANG